MKSAVHGYWQRNGEGVALLLYAVVVRKEHSLDRNIVPFYCCHSNRAMDILVTDPDTLAFLAAIHEITNREVLPARDRAIKRAEEMAAINRNVPNARTPKVSDNGKPLVCSNNNGDVSVQPPPGLSFTTLLSGNSDADGASGVPK